MKAFPWQERLNSNDPNVLNPVPHGGMDLRDYFAAQALPSVINHWIESQDKCREAVYFTDAQDTQDSLIIAEDCYGIADAMMKAREL